MRICILHFLDYQVKHVYFISPYTYRGRWLHFTIVSQCYLTWRSDHLCNKRPVFTCLAVTQVPPPALTEHLTLAFPCTNEYVPEYAIYSLI